MFGDLSDTLKFCILIFLAVILVRLAISS